MSSFMDTLRRLSGSSGIKEPETSSGPTSPRNNVWSSTFDPGRNSNMRKVGASYYDNPSEENKGSIWDEHLKSESSRPKSFDEAPKQPSATIASNKIASAMKQASTGSGTVDYEKFMSLLKQ